MFTKTKDVEVSWHQFDARIPIFMGKSNFGTQNPFFCYVNRNTFSQIFGHIETMTLNQLFRSNISPVCRRVENSKG